MCDQTGKKAEGDREGWNMTLQSKSQESERNGMTKKKTHQSDPLMVRGDLSFHITQVVTQISRPWDRKSTIV